MSYSTPLYIYLRVGTASLNEAAVCRAGRACVEQTQKRGSEKKEDEEVVIGTLAEDPPARSQMQTAGAGAIV